MQVQVERKKLIDILLDNQLQHEEEYNEMLKAYYEAIKKEALLIASQAEACDKNLIARFTAVKPELYSQMYIDVIDMLEMSSNEEFTLSEQDYKRYCKNEWDWSRSFAATKASYGM